MFTALRRFLNDNRWLAYPAVIVLVGVWAYHNSFTVPFIYDDLHDIADNPNIRDLWTSWRVAGGSWRPVSYFTLALNYEVGGGNPRSYHFFNLLIHLLAALTLYGLVRRTLLRVARYERSAATLALAIALIWMAHPMQTESVTYIIQRYESLMGLFYLLTLYCLVRGAESTEHRKSWYWAAVAACALGMGSKEVMVTAPLIALAYDRIFLASSWQELFRQRGWLHAGLACTWLMLFIPIQSAWQGTAGWAGFGAPVHTPFEYARTQPAVILHYLWLSVWPSSLCFDYGWPVANSWQEIVVPTAAILILLSATGWALWRAPPLGFLGLFFFLVLAPTSSIMPIADLAVEHRMYLPLAALASSVVLAASGCLELLTQRANRGAAARVAITTAGLAGVVAALAVLTIQRNAVYHDHATIWSDTMMKRPLHYRPYNNLAACLADRGQIEESIELLQKAIELDPDSALSRAILIHNVARGRERQGRRAEAEDLYRQSLEIYPQYAAAHAHLGALLLRQKKLADAETHLQKAIALDPRNAEAHNYLGLLMLERRRPAEALAYHRYAVELNPDYADAYDDVGVVLWKMGQRTEATQYFRRALELNPLHALAHNNIGVALSFYRRPNEALIYFERAIELQPQLADAHYYRGMLLSDLKKSGAAQASFQKAVDIEPKDFKYRCGLAGALWSAGRQDEARAQYREALRLAPNWPHDTNAAAWQLATHMEEQNRNGALAVVMAEQVCRATEYGNPKYLDTLAAAFAEAGRFDDAVDTARKAIAQADAKSDLAQAIQRRLELYRERQPYREER